MKEKNNAVQYKKVFKIIKKPTKETTNYFISPILYFLTGKG